MLYHFIAPLQEYVSFLRLFQFITFRAAYAALTALVLVLIFGSFAIRWLKHLRFKEEIRDLGPESHKSKAGTPTMGGIIILGALLVSIALWGRFDHLYMLLLIGSTVCFGLLGFIDDYIKAIRKKKDGIPPRMKLLFQVMIASVVAIVMYRIPSDITLSTETVDISSLFVPFFKQPIIENMGIIWIGFAVIMIVGYSNAVNLTDGLDGLATGSVLPVAVVLAIMTYLTGHFKIADYLKIPFIPAGAELTVFISALIGALIGFLWFNSNPATVFMGDTGSLSLGGIIGVVAIMIKKEIFIIIVGGIFVLEALSVIIQVISYKVRGKRVFKMAPIHHHFELSGWTEQKVVVRMWIVGIILAIVGLSSLKIL